MADESSRARDRPRGRTPYEALLGDAYFALHPNVRSAHHAPLRAKGLFDVVHGEHPFTAMFVTVMNLPAAGAAQPVVLRVALVPAIDAEDGTVAVSWSRRIGASPLETRQIAGRGRLIERNGHRVIEFVLHVESGALRYTGVALRFLGWPVPRFLSPRVRAQVRDLAASARRA